MLLARRAMALSLGLLLSGLSAGLAPDTAFAKKKGKAPKVAVPEAPVVPVANPEAIQAVMGNLRFGMTLDETYEGLFKTIDARYQERISKITDIFQQNKLRKQAKAEKDALKQSYVAFDGAESSWDVSLIDREFDQLDDEAMLVQWELDPTSGKNQRRFFFFADGKLWKMFIAFSSEMFPETMTFAAFHVAMEKRFGAGALSMRLDPDGVERFDHVYWSAPGLRVRALDLTKFYSTYALAVSDDTVEGWIAQRREQRNPKTKKESALVNAVADDPNKDPSKASEANSDVIDRMLEKGKGAGKGGGKGTTP